MSDEDYTTRQPIDIKSIVDAGTTFVDLLRRGEEISDESNAQVVHALHGGKFSYNSAYGWMWYTGTHWTTENADAAVDRAIVATLQARQIEAIRTLRNDDAKQYLRKCNPNAATVKNAKTQLSSIAASSPSDFDNHLDLLNCQNGVVDLRTGEVTPHNCAQRFTYCAPVKYIPDADRTFWEKWLSETANPDAMDWLQMAVGYSLTGHTREETLFYVQGPSRSGKGVFIETLRQIMGAHLSAEVDFGVMTAKRDADLQNFALAPLKPCRFVAASETNQYERFNEAKLKALTGGNDIRCAFKHKTPFNFRPQFKIWLSSNHPINADPDDNAVWGRLRVLEFPNSHLGQEDKTLKARMASDENLSGVLAWAIDGAKRWYALGNAGLPEHKTSAELKERQRDALDNVKNWIEECCTISAGHFTSSNLLYQSYRAWCNDNGVTQKQSNKFGQTLADKGFPASRQRIGDKQVRGYLGLII